MLLYLIIYHNLFRLVQDMSDCLYVYIFIKLFCLLNFNIQANYKMSIIRYIY